MSEINNQTEKSECGFCLSKYCELIDSSIHNILLRPENDVLTYDILDTEKSKTNKLLALKEKQRQMKVGEIWQEVLGNYNGCVNLKIGHETGPHLLCNYFTDDTKNKLDLCLNLNNTMHVIKYSNIDILASYIKYREEQQLNKNFISYGDLWKQRKIYL